MENLKIRLQREIAEATKEFDKAIELGNTTYAQTLFFQDILPLQNTLRNL
tara:strand:+ start:1380 stop:1529 length:150 start_codon:yes stop_codon:yes gene_type:complete